MPAVSAAMNTAISDDATFRAASQAVHDALIACGMVETADTGQVNLATMTRPGTVSTYAGYKLYRRDDALQATNPIIMKVEYGTGTAITRWACRVTYGRATDGAGTFVGAATAATVVAAGVGALGTLHASGDDQFTILNFASGTASAEFVLGVDRLRDTETGIVHDGLWLGYAGTSSFSFFRWNPIAATWSTVQAQDPYVQMFHNAGHVGAKLTDIQISPILLYHGKMYAAAVAAYLDAEIPAGTFDADYCGATKGWRALSTLGVQPSASVGIVMNAMRWETA